MNAGWSRGLLLALGSSAALALSAQPVLAETRLGHTGTVGVHSLDDTYAHPGATCKYHYLSTWFKSKLKRIVVEPPRMRAVMGNPAQEVGWTFTIRRRVGGSGGFGPWQSTFTSTEVTAITDDAHNAAFSARSVSITLPFGPGAADAHVDYRAVVSMYWHTSGGGIQGTAKSRVDIYGYVTDSVRVDQKGACVGYF